MTFSMQPTLVNSVYVPDQLIAGNFPLVTDTVTLAAGLSLTRGTLIGQQNGAATFARTSTDTGNFTCSAITVNADAKPGIYSIVFTGATSFEVFDPNGAALPAGATGTAYTEELGFTLTAGGTAAVAGDTATLTVAGSNFVEASLTATDGSQSPGTWAVLAEDTNTSSTGTNAATSCPVYLAGEFDANYMTFGAGLTAVVAKQILRDSNIYIKTNAIANTPV
jgi:hypothetical protein